MDDLRERPFVHQGTEVHAALEPGESDAGWAKSPEEAPGGKRLQNAYLLKETFGQLWSYQTEGWARRSFDNWKASLKWQRLAPYEKFAGMIERHWDGIAAYTRPENKISPGFVEGLNN